MNNLIFPLYHIRACEAIVTEDNITTIMTPYGNYILDNKNIKGDTLGERRLRLGPVLQEDQKLYRLKKIFYTISDIILHKDKYKVYIDSVGQLFTYTKKNRVNLVYKKIKQIEIQETRLLCSFADIFKVVEIPFIPEIMPRYLGLLIFHGDYIFYDMSQEKKKDTWRLI